MNDHVGANALKLAGEVFVPGAAQMLSGKIGAGLVSNLLAGAASVALVGSGGVLGVLGGLAILGIKVNSYASSTTGRDLWEVGSDVFSRRHEETPPPRSAGARSGTSTTS